jgi:hypothetical protein
MDDVSEVTAGSPKPRYGISMMTSSGLVLYPSVRAALAAGVRILSNVPDENGLYRGDVRLANGKLAFVLVRPCEAARAT